VNRKIQEVLDKTVQVLAEWDAVDTLAVLPYEDDIYDPYFFISLDVYFTGELPDAAQRAAGLSFAGGYESAGLNRKDRFLVGDIPVRLEFKDMSRFDAIIANSLDGDVFLRDTGTYMFYRLMESDILFNRSDWMNENRKRLRGLSDDFWAAARKSAESRMEHYLGDLSAAVIRDDDLFFMVSASGFVKSVCGAMFAINQRFEPAPRQMLEMSSSLPVKPDVFQGLLESFIRHSDTSLNRKREVAELLAKKIIQI
jgi:hypothetical protein